MKEKNFWFFKNSEIPGVADVVNGLDGSWKDQRYI